MIKAKFGFIPPNGFLNWFLSSNFGAGSVGSTTPAMAGGIRITSNAGAATYTRYGANTDPVLFGRQPLALFFDIIGQDIDHDYQCGITDNVGGRSFGLRRLAANTFRIFSGGNSSDFLMVPVALRRYQVLIVQNYPNLICTITDTVTGAKETQSCTVDPLFITSSALEFYASVMSTAVASRYVAIRYNKIVALVTP